MVACPSKGLDRNQKPSTATSTSTCTSTITVFVDVDVNVDVLVHVDVDGLFQIEQRSQVHPRKCQTPTATPAEPGDLPTD